MSPNVVRYITANGIFKGAGGIFYSLYIYIYNNNNMMKSLSRRNGVNVLCSTYA